MFNFKSIGMFYNKIAFLKALLAVKKVEGI